MNTSDYERFGELAPKAIAKRADARELAELQAALENHPDLKQEFEMMKVEAAVLEEAVPLFEDIEPEVAVPPLPLDRLRDEVRGAFAQRSKAKARLAKLLPELTKLMTSGRSETERVRAEGLLAALEDFVLTGRSALERKTDAPEPKTDAPEVKTEAPELKADAPAAEEISGGHPVAAGRRAWWDRYVKMGGAEADLEVKLMTMEGRLNNALTHLNNCKDEALTVLNLIREEKNALGRRVAEKIAEKREKGS
jgi:hypothetical protein